MDNPTEPRFTVDRVENGLVRVTVTFQNGETTSFLLRVIPEPADKKEFSVDETASPLATA
jgi:hypothetical protein